MIFVRKNVDLLRLHLLPARSALRGCSGSGSLTRETKDCKTCSVLVAGFQFSAATIGRQTYSGVQGTNINKLTTFLLRPEQYLTLLIDVGVIDLRSEGDFRWLERIFRGKDDVYQKCALENEKM